jgi:hypothetical protein
VPVHSIVVLLRPQAVHANLSGSIVYAPRPERGKMDFRYEVIRLWERPADELLRGDVGAVPLAPLGKLPEGIGLEAGLAGVIHQVIERLNREAAPEQMRRLVTASFVLTGLRVPRQTARQLFQGVRAMRDSDTYMAIIDEGRLEEAKKFILRAGQKSFGPADETVKTFLAGADDLARLEVLFDHISDVKSWKELLATH